MQNRTTRPVLEVIYSAGFQSGLVAYFASDAEYESWLNWPVRVTDANFDVTRVRVVTAATAAKPAGAADAAARQSKLSHGRLVVGGGKPAERVYPEITVGGEPVVAR